MRVISLPLLVGTIPNVRCWGSVRSIQIVDTVDDSEQQQRSGREDDCKGVMWRDGIRTRERER